MSGKCFSPSAVRFLAVSGESPMMIPHSASAAMFEFDESDLWSSPAPTPTPTKAEMRRRMMSSTRAPKKAEVQRRPAGVSTSMPVNIPDWSRILGEARGRPETDDEESELEVEGEEEEEDEKDENGWLPPHEYVAKQMARRRRQRGVVSCSVEEGVGRTLKGRDLWRVRDAIWEKIGFKD